MSIISISKTDVKWLCEVTDLFLSVDTLHDEPHLYRMEPKKQIGTSQTAGELKPNPELSRSSLVVFGGKGAEESFDQFSNRMIQQLQDKGLLHEPPMHRPPKGWQPGAGPEYKSPTLPEPAFHRPPKGWNHKQELKKFQGVKFGPDQPQSKQPTPTEIVSESFVGIVSLIVSIAGFIIGIVWVLWLFGFLFDKQHDFWQWVFLSGK